MLEYLIRVEHLSELLDVSLLPALRTAGVATNDCRRYLIKEGELWVIVGDEVDYRKTYRCPDKWLTAIRFVETTLKISLVYVLDEDGIEWVAWHTGMEFIGIQMRVRSDVVDTGVGVLYLDGVDTVYLEI